MTSSDRPSWDHTWMMMARELAKRSHDPQYQVGALVVPRENTGVLSLGYNGNAPGLPHERESNAPGESGFIHAEVNALIKLDYNLPVKKVMYVTLSPCRMCAKLILAAKIDEVIYADEYRDKGGILLLEREGVKVRRFMSATEKQTSKRQCVHCKSELNLGVGRLGRFCSLLCAVAHEPEEVTSDNHPLKSVIVVTDEKKDVRNPSGKCWNCGKSTASSANMGDATKNRYCSLDCADEDGACSK